MKKLCLAARLAFFIGTVLSIGGAWAAAPLVDWYVQAGSIGDELASGAAVDSQGNAYFASWHDLGGRLADQDLSTNTLAVSKFDPTGKLVWVRQFEDRAASKTPTFARLLVDWNDDLIAGISSAGAEYTFGTTNVFTGTTFVKLSSAGTVLWANGQGNTRVSAPLGVSDTNGDYIFVTSLQGSFQYGGAAVIGGEADLLTMKVGSNGDLKWAKRSAGARVITAGGVVTDAEMNIYVTGTFQGSVAFGQVSTNSNPPGATNGLVIKYDKEGEVDWVLPLRGNGNISLAGATSTGDGTIAVSGYFENGLAFGNQTLGGSNSFLARLDDSGTLVSFYNINPNLFPRELITDLDGGFLLTGNFRDTVNLHGNTSLSKGGLDIILLKLAYNGVIGWSKPFGYIHDDFHYGQTSLAPNGSICMALNGKDGLSAGGEFIPGAGALDAVLVKLKAIEGIPLATEVPVSQQALLGNDAIFYVISTNASRYQWYFNNTRLVGATNNALFIINAGLTNEGFYTVEVSNSEGTIRTAPVTFSLSGKIDAQVSTLAGAPAPGYIDSPERTAVRFRRPTGLKYWSGGALAVADMENHVLRLVDLTGATVTYAGTSTKGFSNGPAIFSQLNLPSSVAVDKSLDLLVADGDNNMIRRVSAFGLKDVSTVAGRGLRGYRNGPPEKAEFDSLGDLAIDTVGNIFVTELTNHVIRKIALDGSVSTFAGTGFPDFCDVIGLKACFNSPRGLVIDADDNLYVADSGNHAIRKVSPQSIVTTIAGTNEVGFRDGPGTHARFNTPAALTMDDAGTLYVADQGNHAIRKIDPDGNVLTVVGLGSAGSSNGNRDQASFRSPSGIAWHPNGSLYVADTGNNSIRRIEPLSATSNPEAARLYLTVSPVLTIFGVPGTTYRIEAAEQTKSEVPLDWTPVATVKVMTMAHQWFDPQPATRKKRFYRAIKVE